MNSADQTPISFVYKSRRSNVLGRNGCVSCNEPLAAKAGLDILEKGGNAADAAAAVASVLALIEPVATGLGGDAFCLFYNAERKTVGGLNGSGHSSSLLTLEFIKSRGFSPEKPIPPHNHGLCVTVPGAPAAWLDTVETFGSGKVSLSDILSRAVTLAEDGFPVTEITAVGWKNSEHFLKESRFGSEVLLDGRAPKVGEIMKNPTFAQTIKELVSKGKKGYYEGRVAQAIVDEVTFAGGVMTLQDLAEHASTLVKPISVNYKGVNVWEIPPNGLGITALMILNILEGFDLKALRHNSVEYLHLLAEAIKLSFADTVSYVADPEKVHVSVDEMLSKKYAEERRSLISTTKALEVYVPGDFPTGSDTTYFSVVDKWGNACSFINSNYQGFGTGLVPKNCGFSLQNRGLGFSLKENSPNVAAPKKRPMHTIIPAMITDARTGNLLACYGIMGGFMQPQAHAQVLLNMLEFGMPPQLALDQPRLNVDVQGVDYRPSIGKILLEEGICKNKALALKNMGHDVEEEPVTGYNRIIFGKGHVITKGAWWAKHPNICNDPNVLWSGADPRCDGVSLSY